MRNHAIGRTVSSNQLLVGSVWLAELFELQQLPTSIQSAKLTSGKSPKAPTHPTDQSLTVHKQVAARSLQARGQCVRAKRRIRKHCNRTRPNRNTLHAISNCTGHHLKYRTRASPCSAIRLFRVVPFVRGHAHHHCRADAGSFSTVGRAVREHEGRGIGRILIYVGDIRLCA